MVSNGLKMMALAALAGWGTTAAADEAAVARGEYLVTLGSCGDCHTPGYFLGAPDMTRLLAGSEVGFELPGLGVFVGPNLTPDAETGLGSWSTADIVKALSTGERPDGRILAPIMPWQHLAKLTEEDLTAIALYLQSLPPISNKVKGPYGPGDTVDTFMFRVLPPGQVAAAAPG